MHAWQCTLYLLSLSDFYGMTTECLACTNLSLSWYVSQVDVRYYLFFVMYFLFFFVFFISSYLIKKEYILFAKQSQRYSIYYAVKQHVFTLEM